MKIKELKQKNKGELENLVEEKKIFLRNFRFAVAGSKTRNVKEGNALKKDIARIMTLLNDEEIKE